MTAEWTAILSKRERPMTNVESAREFYPLGVGHPGFAVRTFSTPEEVLYPALDSESWLCLRSVPV